MSKRKSRPLKNFTRKGYAGSLSTKVLRDPLRLASLLLRVLARVPLKYASPHTLPVRLAILVFEQSGFFEDANRESVGDSLLAQKLS